MLKRVLVVLLSLVVAGYGGAAGYVKFNEINLVYHPGERQVQTPDAALGISPRIVRFTSDDGTALVAYRFAIAAAVTGTFSLWEAGISFVLNDS